MYICMCADANVLVFIWQILRNSSYTIHNSTFPIRREIMPAGVINLPCQCCTQSDINNNNNNSNKLVQMKHNCIRVMLVITTIRNNVVHNDVDVDVVASALLALILFKYIVCIYVRT